MSVTLRVHQQFILLEIKDLLGGMGKVGGEGLTMGERDLEDC